MTFQSRGEEDTIGLGKAFGKTAPNKGTIALIGPMGAGKTLFVRGLAEGLDIPSDTVASPTYVLVHLHEGRLPLCHADLYRLEGEIDLASFGLDELLEGEGIAAIEWADKGLEALPLDHLRIKIQTLEADRRDFVMNGTDEGHRAWIERAMQSTIVLSGQSLTRDAE